MFSFRVGHEVIQDEPQKASVPALDVIEAKKPQTHLKVGLFETESGKAMHVSNEALSRLQLLRDYEISERTRLSETINEGQERITYPVRDAPLPERIVVEGLS